ncbi:CDF family Co(II)/Ni(II) efflux transporter DmeF [Desulfovibrionales bacterium]
MSSHCCEHNHQDIDELVHGERGARVVFWLTIATMGLEIFCGWFFGSMALLADGWHMASHAGAMAVAWFAYVYARRNANNPDLVFGAGKVNALAGFGSAVGLVLVAVFMAAESLARIVSPVPIAFWQAIFVAVLGLVINMVSAWLLRDKDDTHAHDHNLKAAYIHVLADALTSVLAIVALLGGAWYGLNWLDPLMGIVGAVVVGKWALGLLKDTSHILLDRRIETEAHATAYALVQAEDGVRVRDLSIWNIGPRRHAARLAVEDFTPRPPEYYKDLLRGLPNIDQVMVEVYACPGFKADETKSASEECHD